MKSLLAAMQRAGRLGILLLSRRQRDEVILYSQFLKSGDLCFDIGANVGRKVEIFRALSCRVIAFEPQPSCVAELHQRFTKDSAVTVVPEGVSEKAGELTLHLAKATEIASMSADFMHRNTQSLRFGGNVWAGSIQVKVDTLDSAIIRYGRPAFIKIDVEGHEQEVLSGLSTSVPALSFEFSAETIDTAFRIAGNLEMRFQMEFNFCAGKTLKLAKTSWLSASALTSAMTQLLRSDERLWGDIYARSVVSNRTEPRA